MFIVEFVADQNVFIIVFKYRYIYAYGNIGGWT